ncbi:MAG: ABC transporter ATP-binding protein [Syntrophobacterales bacterium]|nr:MAG: ABC transporter ATP-binding protein [Syntrophobacterales bacterium]
MTDFRIFFKKLIAYARPQAQDQVPIRFRICDISFLKPHIKKFRSRYAILSIFVLLSSVLSLPGPAITGYIIDKVLVAKDATKLNSFVGLLLAILLLSEFIRTFEEYLLLRLSQEFTYSIRIQLITRILRFPLSFFKDINTGYLVSRLDEVNLLGNFFSVAILSFIENVIRFMGAIFLIARYNLKLTLIALLALPLVFEVARRSMGAIRASSLSVMERSAKIRGKIQETLSGIELVKSYAGESRETNEINTGLSSARDSWIPGWTSIPWFPTPP